MAASFSPTMGLIDAALTAVTVLNAITLAVLTVVSVWLVSGTVKVAWARRNLPPPDASDATGM